MSVPRGLVPVLVILLALGGLGAARIFAIPSVELEFAERPAERSAPTRVVSFLVDGVKCVDTARAAASTLEDLPGALRFVAYASRNRVEVTYDPGQIDIGELREALEGPVFNEESGEFFFDLYEVLEIDGRPVSK